MMKDNDKPEVEVKLAEDAMTASVTVTFPLMSQAIAFGEVCQALLSRMPEVTKAPEEDVGEEKEAGAPMKSSGVLSWDDLKKETQLLIFMVNCAAPTGSPFEVGTDGEEAIGHGIARTKECLHSRLYQLKLKGHVANISHGQWILTTDGKREASWWMKRCGMV